MALSREREFVHPQFFKWLCKEYPESVVIMEWEGRSEDKLDRTRGHFSYFYGKMKFDIVRAYRTPDEKISPIMIGYEVKGTEKISRGSVVKYQSPPIHEGIGQADLMLLHDCNYVYVVRPPLERDSDNEAMIQHYKKKPHYGLYLVNQVNGQLIFKEEVKIIDKEPNLDVHLDRKKINLAEAVMHDAGYREIQPQDWARKGEFVKFSP